MDMFSQIYRAVSSRLPSISSSVHTSRESRMNPKEIQDFVEVIDAAGLQVNATFH